MAKGLSSDIYNEPGVTRIVPTFWPKHSLKFNSNNGPSPGHFNLGSDNGPGGDSNSGPVLATWHLFESDSNNGTSLGHSSLVSDEVYICSGLLLMVSW